MSSLQARINAFESLAGSSTTTTTTKSPPRNIPRRIEKSPPAPVPSLLESPPAPEAASFQPIVPSPFPKSASASPVPIGAPQLDRKDSLIDLKDWVVDDGLPSPPCTNGSTLLNGYADLKTPTTKAARYSPHSPPLINLESPPRTRQEVERTNGHALKAPPLPPRKPSLTSLKSDSSGSATSLPHKLKLAPPPVPPRHNDTLTVEHTYPPLSIDTTAKGRSGHAPASSISSFHSVSLSSDTDISTPGSLANHVSTYPIDRDLSTGTSSGTGPQHTGSESSISPDESFENVSATSFGSPTVLSRMSSQYEELRARQRPPPPKLPQRPQPASASSSRPPSVKSPPPRRQESAGAGVRSTPASPKIRTAAMPPPLPTTSSGRRMPPPPPAPPSRSSASDRSSILSNASNFSSNTSGFTHAAAAAALPIARKPSKAALPKLSIARPTPVPAVARKRYEAVFVSNVIQRRRAEKEREKAKKPGLLSPTMGAKRTRAGWRGLSVDLIEDEDNPALSPAKENAAEDVDPNVGDSELLEGYIVKHIWSRSRLDKNKLKEIWTECDPSHKGSLDRDAFLKGMWRIDEELRRIQLRSANSPASSLASARRQALKTKALFR